MNVKPRLFGLVDFSLRHRTGIVVFYCLLAAVAAPGLLLLETDNSPDVFFPRLAQSLQQYEEFVSLFGHDQALRLAVSGDGLWTEEGLAWLEKTERETAALFGVIGSAGLVRHHAWQFQRWPPRPEILRELALQDPLDRSAGWVSQDGSIVTILIGLAKLSSSQLATLTDQLAELASQPPKGVQAWVAGLPLLQHALDVALGRFLAQYFPWLLAVILGLMLLVLPRPADLLGMLLVVSVCQVTVLGLMGYAGQSLDMILILIVPLLLVITLATVVHVMLRWRRHLQLGLEGESAIRATFCEKLWPVTCMGLTTVSAFGSLMVSRVPPVRALGFWAALGISLATLAVLTFFPALLAQRRSASAVMTATSFEARGRRWGESLAVAAVRNRKWVFGGFAVTAIAGFLGMTRLEPDSDLRDYFRQEQWERWQIARLQESGVGVVSAELILGPGDRPVFALEDGQRRLANLVMELRSRPGVLGTVSLVEVLRSRAAGTGVSGKTLRAPSGPGPVDQILPFLVTRDGRVARVSIQTPLASAQTLQPLFADWEAVALRHFPELPSTLTGSYPLILAAQSATLATMLTSVALAFGVVAVVFCIVMGGLRLGLPALLPNLWPVVFVLGLMGWLDLPLDSTTIMIAAVALGLVVDDSLHTLALFRTKALSAAPGAAAVAALRSTAGAHGFTSLLLVCGFGVCALSDFLPVARFGALSAIAIALALAGDLVLMPAVLGGPSGEPIKNAAA